jgi:hypothetical protein
VCGLSVVGGVSHYHTTQKTELEGRVRQSVLALPDKTEELVPGGWVASRWPVDGQQTTSRLQADTEAAALGQLRTMHAGGSAQQARYSTES